MEFLLAQKMVVNDSFVDSSSSEETDSEEILFLINKKKHRDKHIKNTNYIANIVHFYSDSDFKSHFRLSRTAIHNLLRSITQDKLHITGRPPVPLSDCILMTIWLVSTLESIRSVADRFGFSKGQAHTIFIKTCKLISAKVKDYINWPTGPDALKTVTQFSELRGNRSFPNVIGCVDGTHIPIPGHLNDNSYYNRKGYHSILLQGICNSKLEFIDIYCGWPGSVNDARMWQNSPIFNKICDENILPPNTYLLGDSAYPLRTFIMAPFRDNGHLCQRQRTFNKLLSSTRVVIEQAFGRLKGMFRRLKYLHVLNLKYAKFIIFTCCILHNISLKEDSAIVEDDEFYIPEENNEEADIEDFERIDRLAVELRNSIMNNICH